MKPRFSLLACFLLALTCTALAGGDYYTKIVESDDEVLRITVEQGHVIKIINFVQEGGATRALVGANNPDGRTSYVLTSSLVGTEREMQKELIVAGPTEITVFPVTDAHIFLTYRLEED